MVIKIFLYLKQKIGFLFLLIFEMGGSNNLGGSNSKLHIDHHLDRGFNTIGKH